MRLHVTSGAVSLSAEVQGLAHAVFSCMCLVPMLHKSGQRTPNSGRQAGVPSMCREKAHPWRAGPRQALRARRSWELAAAHPPPPPTAAPAASSPAAHVMYVDGSTKAATYVQPTDSPLRCCQALLGCNWSLTERMAHTLSDVRRRGEQGAPRRRRLCHLVVPHSEVLQCQHLPTGRGAQVGGLQHGRQARAQLPAGAVPAHGTARRALVLREAVDIAALPPAWADSRHVMPWQIRACEATT